MGRHVLLRLTRVSRVDALSGLGAGFFLGVVFSLSGLGAGFSFDLAEGFFLGVVLLPRRALDEDEDDEDEDGDDEASSSPCSDT